MRFCSAFGQRARGRSRVRPSLHAGAPGGADRGGDRRRHFDTVVVPANRMEAIERAKTLVPSLAEIMSTGIVSASGIARQLSARGIDGRWRTKSVRAMLDRLPELGAFYDQRPMKHGAGRACAVAGI